MAQMPKSQVQATFKLMSEDRIKVNCVFLVGIQMFGCELCWILPDLSLHLLAIWRIHPCSKHIFQGTFHPFDQGICNALKTVKSRWFDEQTRAWSIGIEDAREAANVLKAVKVSNVIFGTIQH